MTSPRAPRRASPSGAAPEARERPRELLERSGAENLPLETLLSVVLGGGCAGQGAEGLARQLLQKHGTLRALDCVPFAELRSFRGIGLARAAQLKASLEIGKRLERETAPKERAITQAAHAVRYVSAYYGPYLRDAPREYFCVVLLNRRNRPIRNVELTRGTVSASVVEPREVAREAILAGASAVLLVHNHPSGDPEPSGEDLRITTEVEAVCRSMGIELLDHVIVGRNRADLFSFRDAGLLK